LDNLESKNEEKVRLSQEVGSLKQKSQKEQDNSCFLLAFI